jgi:hypothetical protein
MPGGREQLLHRGGIVATCVEKLRKAERWRIMKGEHASCELDGWNGHFLIPMEGDIWLVRISDGWGFRHLSISNAQSRKLPSWTVMCRMKEAFFSDEDWCVQYFPPKTEYINDCGWCLHLWQPLNDPLPTPHWRWAIKDLVAAQQEIRAEVIKKT